MRSAAKSFSIALLLTAAALSQTGCRMCCAPYDYTGPVPGCECEGGTWHGRRASAVSHFADASPADPSLVASDSAAPTFAETAMQTN